MFIARNSKKIELPRRLTLCASVSVMLFLGGCQTLDNTQASAKTSQLYSQTAQHNNGVPIAPPSAKIKSQDASCYYNAKAPNARKLPLSKKKGRVGGVAAILVGLSPDTLEFVSYYPTPNFQKKLESTKSRQGLIAMVKNANPTRDFARSKTTAAPMDFNVNNNSSTVFRLLPKAWHFQDDGFYFKPPIAGKYSPFSPSPEIDRSKKLALIDFDRLNTTPQGKATSEPNPDEGCHYKYDLSVFVKSARGDKTRITIDPIIGNTGGPPIVEP